jgi:toxin-antitoxin system PIN domain toxin
MTPDVNVLVAAGRSDHPHHRPAKSWLEGALATAGAGGPALVLMPMVLASVLRLLTSPRIFIEPTPTDAAVRFVDAIVAAPGVRIGPLSGEWPALRERCVSGGLRGNAIPDAWLAAAVEHQAEHLVSFDRDFAALLPRSSWTLLGT